MITLIVSLASLLIAFFVGSIFALIHNNIVLAVVLLVFIFICLFSIIGLVVGHWLFKLKNDPSKAWIFELVGNEYIRHKGTLLTEVECQQQLAKQKNTDKKAPIFDVSGKLFIYDNNQKILVVPTSKTEQPIRYWSNRRVLGVTAGNIIASPLGNAPPEKNNGKPTLVKDLLMSHLASQIIRTMTGKGVGMSILIVILVLVMLLVGGGIFMYNQSQKSKQPMPQTTTTTNYVPTANTTIILPPSGPGR